MKHKTRRGGWFRRLTRKRSLSTVVKGAIHDFIKHDLENSTCDSSLLQDKMAMKIKASVDSWTSTKGGAFNRRCTRLRPKNWFYTNKCCDMQKALKTKYSDFNITVPSHYTNEECVDLLRTFMESKDPDLDYDCKILKSVLIKLTKGKTFQTSIAELKNDANVKNAIDDMIGALFQQANQDSKYYKINLNDELYTQKEEKGKIKGDDEVEEDSSWFGRKVKRSPNKPF